MNGFEPSLFTSSLESRKTYTLTWYSPSTWRKNGLCRCRFDFHCYMWALSSNSTPIEAFVSLLSGNCLSFLGERNFRLIKAGKLVARQATYQGV